MATTCLHATCGVVKTQTASSSNVEVINFTFDSSAINTEEKRLQELVQKTSSSLLITQEKISK